MAILLQFLYFLVILHFICSNLFQVEILFLYSQIIFGRKAVKEEFKYLLAELREFCTKELSMTIYVHLDLNFSTINYHLVIFYRQTWHKLTTKNFYQKCEYLQSPFIVCTKYVVQYIAKRTTLLIRLLL